jgi:NAD dependent epimerase/dehydratase
MINLVTGADGFIGSHLCELLLKKKQKVIALNQYNSFDQIGNLKYFKHKNLKIINGDIRDTNFCNTICKGVDKIYNLAALISIPYSYQAIESYIDTNIKGTYNICLAAHKNSVKKLIQLSTSEVYGTAKYTPIDEKHPYQPQSPYSASKISSDMMALSFYYSKGLNVTIARPFNTYGPRQSMRAIIPTIIFQNLFKKKITLGNIYTVRDFTYVSDTCEALYKVSSNKYAGEIFNIGSNNKIKINDLINTIKNITKINNKIEIVNKRLRPKKSEVYLLNCNNKKIKNKLNFHPKINLRSGLKETIKWVQKNYASKIKKNQYYF